MKINNLRLVCLGLLISMTASLQAQNYTTESPDYKLEFKAYSEGRIGGNVEIFAVLSDAVLTVQPHMGEKRFSFNVYDKNLELAQTKLIEKVDLIPDSLELSQVFTHGDRIFGLAYRSIIREWRSELYLMEFDPKNLRFHSEIRLISHTEGRHDFFRDVHNSFVNVDFSNDSSLVLISHKLSANKVSSGFRFMIFNLEMNLIESHDVELLIDGNMFMPEGKDWKKLEGERIMFRATGSSPFKIDDFGTIHTFGRYVKDKKKRWWTCSVHQGESHFSEIVRHYGYRSMQYKIVQGENSKNVWLINWYYIKEDRSSGYIIQKLNQSKPDDPIYLQWDYDTMAEFVGYSQEYAAECQSYGMLLRCPGGAIRSIYLLEDNNLLLVMEMTGNFGDKASYITQNLMGNLLLTKISDKGQILQTNVFHKAGNAHLLLEDNVLNVFAMKRFFSSQEDFVAVSELGVRSGGWTFVLNRIFCSELRLDDTTVFLANNADRSWGFEPKRYGLRKFRDDYIAWSQLNPKRGMFLFRSLK